MSDNSIAFYSIYSKKFVHIIRGFRSSILELQSSPTALLVILKSEMIVLNPENVDERLFSIKKTPACTAVGFRGVFLAVCNSISEKDSNRDSTTSTPQSSASNGSNSAQPSSKELVSKLSTGIYTISGKAVQTFNEYWTGISENRSNNEQIVVIGSSIKIYNVQTNKQYTELRTKYIVGNLTFDKSGQILVATEFNCQYLHVYKFQNCSNKIRHVYKIFRGFTHANIRDITFSPNSKFLCCTTSRATFHLFVIDDPKLVASQNKIENNYDPLYKDFDKTQVAEISASHRIHFKTNDEVPIKIYFYSPEIICIQTTNKTYMHKLVVEEYKQNNQDKTIVVKSKCFQTITGEKLSSSSAKSYPYLHNILFPYPQDYITDATSYYIKPKHIWSSDRPSLWNSPQLVWKNYSPPQGHMSSSFSGSSSFVNINN
eukprot:UN24587